MSVWGDIEENYAKQRRIEACWKPLTSSEWSMTLNDDDDDSGVYCESKSASVMYIYTYVFKFLVGKISYTKTKKDN